MPNAIDRPFLQQLRSEVNAALLEVGKRNGVLLTLGRGTFSPLEAKFSMTVTLADANTTAAVAAGVSPKNAKAASDYTRLAASYGLKPEWLGKWFSTGVGTELKVVGLLPNRHVNVVLVQGRKGGQYIMSAEEVAGQF